MLYRDYAAPMPVFDYHSHLPARIIAENECFRSITEAWLTTDHYKWRAMRSNGVDEAYITGDRPDREKFIAWAGTVPRTIRNPLYHWTHMELRDVFGIEDVFLDGESASGIFDRCNELLPADEYRPRALLERMHVRVLFTTDDPADSLMHHRNIREDSAFNIAVLPTFRPDRAVDIQDAGKFNLWVSRLESASDVDVKDFSSFVEAVERRHDAFHEAGCRASDHALDEIETEPYTEGEVQSIFRRVRKGERPDIESIRKFRTCMLEQFARMNRNRNWAQMLHLGAHRNNCTRRFQTLGPDSGFDAMGDRPIGRPLVALLDRLDRGGILPKTVLFVINPRDNDLIVSIMGSFQDGSVPGKMQFGPAWWFNDTREGMIAHLNALSGGGLLSRFIGMVTDSRSFLSFPRHDYFRRILCSLLGGEMGRGEIPEDIDLVGSMVRDICYRNAASYFNPGTKR
jgi:glucuronate isomerase